MGHDIIYVRCLRIDVNKFSEKRERKDGWGKFGGLNLSARYHPAIVGTSLVNISTEDEIAWARVNLAALAPRRLKPLVIRHRPSTCSG